MEKRGERSERGPEEPTPSWWLDKLHHRLGEILAELRKLNECNEHENGTIINIEHCTFIGGKMPLDLSKLVAEVTADTTVGDELDTVVDAVVAAYSGATSQAEIDSITAQLNKNTTRQQLKQAALKNLVGPGSGGGGGVGALSASFNGPPTATVGTAYTGSVTAAGGTAPYSYTGAAPAWLVVAADGSVSGTPDVAGEAAVSGSVTDAAGASAQWSGSISVS